jgi:hypothetical protein
LFSCSATRYIGKVVNITFSSSISIVYNANLIFDVERVWVDLGVGEGHNPPFYWGIGFIVGI